MKSGDWERTMAAVVIVGFLAESIGDEDRDKAERVVNNWVSTKMQELRFMRRFA